MFRTRLASSGMPATRGRTCFPLVPRPRPVQIANSDLAQSNYKALVTEIRTHGRHGLTTDLSYTLSRSEGNASDSGAFVESWTTLWNQDPYNLKNLTHQVNDWNHTHEVKG